MDLASLRTEYQKRSLSEEDVDRDPIKQFNLWMNEAIKAQALEPTAMACATCTKDGFPSARMVLLKHVDENGFVFYTNYQSRKGQELETNPRCALLFFWPELERQVRIEGDVVHTTVQESLSYFITRPLLSRIGAVASTQSQTIPSRRFLEEAFAKLKSQFQDGNIPRPSHWGGYRVTPKRIEFWQGRPSRLHDRIEYVRDNEQWTIHRLAP